MTTHEAQANDAIYLAIKALRVAVEACEQVGYGSQILGPLDDSLKALEYAEQIAREA